MSRTSRYYPKGIPKTSVRLVVPRTSAVLFVERMSGGPHLYVRTKDRGVHPVDLAYVRLLSVSVWLLFSKGSKYDQVNTKGLRSH